ncbi:Hypothetical protein LUCI_3699 [Lucifera butyrica]|uniref:Stage 0 sporulation protein A homolog n=1 Tax=Lucifera butyrica TaxID=1351585 RepID=A0A498RBY0_9FIRM|nr:response regulator [Lucifera butyrica]VBB08427.1 Hypothetical protein LUCI_3699 [Lucifera butyrica]
MYKVAIVDDDRIIRKGLASTIPWEENGYCLVGEAADGEEGIRLIEKFCPQVVISDIKMPFMDGLEMGRMAKNKYPDIKIILLTGYDDFAYAQEAIKLRAFDYLLKPVDKEKLLEKVRIASAEWEQEKKIKEKMNEGMPFFKHVFLKKLLSRQFSPAELRQEAASLGIALSGEYFAVLLVKLDSYLAMPGIAAKTAEKEFLKQSVLSVCQKVLTDSSLPDCAFELPGDELVMLCAGNAAAGESEEGARCLAEQVRAAVKEFLQETVTITYGKGHRGIAGIAVSYQEANLAMSFRHFVGKDKVFSVLELPSFTNHNSVSFASRERELIQTVKLGSKKEALAVLQNLKTEILHCPRISLEEVRFFTVQMIFVLFQGVQELVPDWIVSQRENVCGYYNTIHRLQTIEEIVNLAETIVSGLADFIIRQREEQRCPAVVEAMRYITQNYNKKGLSLQDIAQHVHMNPFYISALFKQEKNITFSEYLLQTRMKKAMELLRCHNMKAYEVAECVGYGNPEYFSVCFKKYTGVSPVDFKKGANSKDG